MGARATQLELGSHGSASVFGAAVQNTGFFGPTRLVEAEPSVCQGGFTVIVMRGEQSSMVFSGSLKSLQRSPKSHGFLLLSNEKPVEKFAGLRRKASCRASTPWR